jgi:dynein intermediate chain 2
MIFKDPNAIKRAVTKISWHPDISGELRVGVSYAMLRFQQMPPKMPLYSYIWNLQNPNFPEKTLAPPSALCTMVFNPKHQDVIAGGSYNGSLSFFDTRKGNSSVLKPTETTILEKSHHEPVYDIYWLTVGKTGTECISTSTDGRLLFWDMRNLGNGPMDELKLNDTYTMPGASEPSTQLLGGTSLEYNPEAGPLKYLVGSE